MVAEHEDAAKEHWPVRSLRRIASWVALALGAIAAWFAFRRAPPAPALEPAYAPPAGTPAGQEGPMILGPDEKRQLLGLAREALTRAVGASPPPSPPEDLPAKLLEPRGCFVTLDKHHQLRGCIGHIFPKEPLALAIIHNAASAALHDSRFPPVTLDELADIEIEVSILTVPAPLRFTSPDQLLQQLRPNVDGVVLDLGIGRATYLPQVWEQLPQPARFMEKLAQKAGGSAEAWRGPDASVQIYQVVAFSESTL